MIWNWASILAQDDGYGEELFYVIAVLILSVGGAIYDRLKKKRGEPKEDEAEEGPAPKPPVRPSARPSPVKRLHPPTARPAAMERPVKAVKASRRIRVRPRAHKPPAPPISEPQPATLDTRKVSSPIVSVMPSEKQGERDLLAAKTALRPKMPKTSTSVGSFKGISIKELRRAIVLSEILAPPLALREDEQI